LFASNITKLLFEVPTIDKDLLENDPRNRPVQSTDQVLHLSTNEDIKLIFRYLDVYLRLLKKEEAEERRIVE
jgi:hypothetical protein